MKHGILAVLGLLAVACLAVAPASAQQVVRLGAYDFPPYAENTPDGMGGMVADLAAALNARQQAYVFEVVPTSAQGRYDDMASGRIDAIAFESADWGWQDADVAASAVFMEGREVYCALRAPGRDQSFFDAVGDHAIAATWGWHYGFAGFNADPAWLQRHFRIELPLYPGSALFHVLERRVDLAVVPELYLHRFLAQHPEYRDRFLVGDRPDQIYHFSVLLRRDGPLALDRINTLLAEMEADGTIARIAAAYRE